MAKIPFIIAGKDPSNRLIRKSRKNKNVSIVSNPSDAELNDLIAKAQIHVLPSFNKTGIKLKLINALYNGRHCVVNDEAVEGSGLEDACHIGTTSKAIASIITQLIIIRLVKKRSISGKNYWDKFLIIRQMPGSLFN